MERDLFANLDRDTLMRLLMRLSGTPLSKSESPGDRLGDLPTFNEDLFSQESRIADRNFTDFELEQLKRDSQIPLEASIYNRPPPWAAVIREITGLRSRPIDWNSNGAYPKKPRYR